MVERWELQANGSKMTVYCVLFHEKKAGLSKLSGLVLQVTLAYGYPPTSLGPAGLSALPSWLCL